MTSLFNIVSILDLMNDQELLLVIYTLSDHLLKDLQNFAAKGGHSLLWLKATAFLSYKGAYPWPEPGQMISKISGGSLIIIQEVGNKLEYTACLNHLLHNHLLYAFNCWNVNWGIQAFSVLCHIFDIITIISSWIIQCIQWWPLELEAFYNEMFS